MQIPDAFLRAVASEAGFELPPARAYAAGTAFLPGDDEAVAKTRTQIEEIAAEEGLTVLLLEQNVGQALRIAGFDQR